MSEQGRHTSVHSQHHSDRTLVHAAGEGGGGRYGLQEGGGRWTRARVAIGASVSCEASRANRTKSCIEVTTTSLVSLGLAVGKQWA